MITRKPSLKGRMLATLFGLFLFFALLEICLRLAGLIFTYRQERENTILTERKDIYTILCVGESTTAVAADAKNGFLVDETSYPRQLGRMLNATVGSRKFRVINKGIMNGDSAQTLEALDSELELYKPAMVIAMMGNRDTTATPSFTEKTLLKKPKDLVLSRLKSYGFLRALMKDLEEKRQAQSGRKPDVDSAVLALIKDGRIKDAERLFQRVLRAHPGGHPYALFGRFYREQQEYGKAEAVLNEAKERTPGRIVFLELGRLYKDTRRYREAEEMFRKALGGNLDDEVYLDLGQMYRKMKRYKDMEAMFSKGMATHTNKHRLYFELENLYQKQGRYAEAEAVYKNAIAVNGSYGDYLNLAQYYAAGNRWDEARETMRTAVRTVPATPDNYRRLQDILAEKGIVLVAMQYPARSVEFLKDLLSPQKGFILVDNEEIFKAGPYHEFYFERSYRRMPHYTKRGAELLARNAAQALRMAWYPRIRDPRGP